MALAACKLLAQGALLASSSAAAGFATKSGAVAVVRKNWKDVKLPAATVKDLPTTTVKGASFEGDLRATSGNGEGDGLTTHTSKWLQVRLAGGEQGGLGGGGGTTRSPRRTICQGWGWGGPRGRSVARWPCLRTRRLNVERVAVCLACT